MVRRTGIVALMIVAFMCSCSQSGSRVVPVSDLSVERLCNNSFPLSPWSLTRDSSGVSASYRFVSQNCLCTSEPVLLCREAENFTATMNGMPLMSVPGRYLIAGLVQEGENVIELHGTGELGPVSLAGEFGVWLSADGSWYTDKGKAPELGLLSRQGYPFYSGEMAYRRTFEVPEKVGRRVLRIPEWKGDSCSVWVNDIQVARLVRGKRFKKDVTPYLKPGPNNVEVRLRCSSGDFGLMKEFMLE